MKRKFDDSTVVIMAGGKGTRFGAAGQKIPKCLLRVGRETLLQRLIDQLRQADIRTIVVACSPDNVSAIQSAIEANWGQHEFPDAAVRTLACERSGDGFLPALDEALSKFAAAQYLVCLGDIYFAGNPFHHIASNPALPCLFAGTDLTGSDLSATGWLACEDSKVCAISRGHFENLASRNVQSRRWTGTFSFPEDFKRHLHEHAREYGQNSFEFWIQALIRGGAAMEWADAGGFVNVNSPIDYQFLTQRHANSNLGARKAHDSNFPQRPFAIRR
jgi:NDP-sugar pyrophosphorylase family protein